MANPNPSIWNSDNSKEITAINYSIGNAGTILPLTTTFVPGDVHTDTEIIDIDIDIPTGSGIKFTTSEADLPDPLAVDTLYFAIRVSGTEIKVATSYANAIAGTEINLTGGGAGTHSITMDNEYHIWNDKGMDLTSDNMISVKATVRDANGLEVSNITIQKWVEIKSLTIHDGGAGGDYVAAGVTHDNMADFQPVGKDGYLGLGDIPPDCYRKVMIRVNIPTSALEAGVTFKIYVTNQQPSSPIAKWLTGLFGDGITSLGDRLEVTNPAGDDSDIDIASGWALINNKEIYKSAAETYTISTDAGVYKIYLTRDGVYGSTVGAIPANSILLAWVTIAGNFVTDVVDKREFIGQRVICQHFQDLKIAAANGIHAAIEGTGAIQNIIAAITNPDYARNISITTTKNDSPAGDVKIIGIVRGKNDEEDITITAPGVAYGNKAFDTVTKIVIPAGVPAGDFVTVGFSDKIGLSNPIMVAGDVFKKKVNNIDETHELTDAANVNATYHTVDCSTIVLYEDMEIRYKSILTI